MLKKQPSYVHVFLRKWIKCHVTVHLIIHPLRDQANGYYNRIGYCVSFEVKCTTVTDTESQMLLKVYCAEIYIRATLHILAWFFLRVSKIHNSFLFGLIKKCSILFSFRLSSKCLSPFGNSGFAAISPLIGKKIDYMWLLCKSVRLNICHQDLIMYSLKLSRILLSTTICNAHVWIVLYKNTCTLMAILLFSDALLHFFFFFFE